MSLAFAISDLYALNPVHQVVITQVFEKYYGLQRFAMNCSRPTSGRHGSKFQ